MAKSSEPTLRVRQEYGAAAEQESHGEASNGAGRVRRIPITLSEESEDQHAGHPDQDLENRFEDERHRQRA
jgi:hypothetical protein